MDPAAFLLVVAGGIIALGVVLAGLVGMLSNVGNDPLTMAIKHTFLGIAVALQAAGCIVELL